MYDIIVIGAGPAGVSAAIYAASRGKKTLVLEKTAVGGVVGKVSTVTHYSGIIEHETGETFANRLKTQLLNSGVDFRYEQVTEVSLKPEVKKVITEKSTYESRCVILANGTTPNKLGIPGETELAGKGVCSNAAKDAPSCRGKHVYVVGGADGAVKEALYLAQFASTVTIIHFEEKLGCIAEFQKKIAKTPNIELCLNSRLHAIIGKTNIEELEIASEKDHSIRRVDAANCAVFIYAGASPNTALYSELTLKNGYIPVNENMETEIPGVYAAGDIRVKLVRQAATAVSDGAVAAVRAAAF